MGGRHPQSKIRSHRSSEVLTDMTCLRTIIVSKSMRTWSEVFRWLLGHSNELQVGTTVMSSNALCTLQIAGWRRVMDESLEFGI